MFSSSLKERFSLHSNKNLGRVDFIINQFICLVFTVPASFFGLYSIMALLRMFSVAQTLPSVSLGLGWWITHCAVAGISLVAVAYFTLLSLCNTQGRFTNLQVENKVLAWIVYLLVGFNAFTSLLRYTLYLLPPGFFKNRI